MVKGFYVAVDSPFGWNNRIWYKTTGALVAPADRFAINKPPTFAGLRLAAESAEAIDPKLPTAFVLSTTGRQVQVRPREAAAVGCVGAGRAASPSRASPGKVAQSGDLVYRETTEGWWMKGIDGTYTDPGPPPEGLSRRARSGST